MKIVWITPASDLRRLWGYRVGNRLYGHANAITGPLVLGHILKDAGHDVSVYEELYEDLPLSDILDADIYCLYTMTSNAPRAYQLADRLRHDTRARVIIGGMHASALPEEAAEHADQVVVGEAESVICDVVAGRIKDKIVNAPYVKNLDEIPFPDYSLLKTPCEVANVLSTRGCPFCCSFCTTSRMFHPYRERSIESVLAELRYYKRCGFKYMNFEDDNFTANKERTKEICRRMIAENLVFKETFFFGRTDMANDEELLTLLERAHLSRVLIGIESLNQESLNQINKKQKIADIQKCAQALSRHKIRLISSIVLGIDTDMPKDIQRSVRFSRRINAYQLQPAILTPFPGTADYQKCCKENRMLTKDWSLFDMMHVTFLPKNFTPWELQRMFFKAAKSFYSFLSAFKIMKLFGAHFGMRRLGLWLVVHLGVIGANIVSLVGKHTYFYWLRHMGKHPKVGMQTS